MEVNKPTIGTSAVKIAQAAEGFIVNRAANPVYIGPTSSVTAETGLTLETGEKFAFKLGRKDSVYVIAAQAGNVVEVVIS
jgi:hypothetical protein